MQVRVTASLSRISYPALTACSKVLMLVQNILLVSSPKTPQIIQSIELRSGEQGGRKVGKMAKIRLWPSNNEIGVKQSKSRVTKIKIKSNWFEIFEKFLFVRLNSFKIQNRYLKVIVVVQPKAVVMTTQDDCPRRSEPGANQNKGFADFDQLTAQYGIFNPLKAFY